MEAPTVLSAQTCKDLDLLGRVHLLQQQSLSTCPEGCMSSTQIYFKAKVVFEVNTPGTVPVSLKEKIKEELDRMEKAEVVVK